jgi:hypothetical protein
MLRRIEDMPAGTMRPAPATLSFLLPGRAKAFRNSDLAAAKAWLAAE